MSSTMPLFWPYIGLLIFLSAGMLVPIDAFLSGGILWRYAFTDVKSVLKPDGMFVMYNYFRQGWIVERIVAMASRKDSAKMTPANSMGPSPRIQGAARLIGEQITFQTQICVAAVQDEDESIDDQIKLAVGRS